MQKINMLKLSNEESKRLTRKFICDALLKQMHDIEFEKITITNIVKEAGVSRTAFYKNYESKDDVLKDIITSINIGILDTIGRPFTKGVSKTWYKQLFETLITYEDVIKLIFNAGFQSYYLKITNDIIISKADVKGTTDKYERLVWNGAFQNIFWEWIRKGKEETIDFMSDFCYNYFILRGSIK